jgi:hypothetical protein
MYRVLSISDISAVLVTRGDVDLTRIMDSLPYEEIVIWDNKRRPFDAGAFGRYLAIHETTRPVIYFQDDDCLFRNHDALRSAYVDGDFVANMPEDKNREYPLLVLPGWGSLVRRDLPWRAIELWCSRHPIDEDFIRSGVDIVFPVLMRSRRVDLGYENLDYARAPNRTFRQPGYFPRKDLYYADARALRLEKEFPSAAWIQTRAAGLPYGLRQDLVRLRRAPRRTLGRLRRRQA